MRRYLLTPSGEPGIYDLDIDNTRLEIFGTCPRKAEYLLIHGRTPPAGAALKRGSFIHTASEIWRTTGSVEQALEAGAREYEGFTVEPDEWRTLDRAIADFMLYLKEQKLIDEEYKQLVSDAGPIVEHPFRLPIGEIEVGSVLPGDINLLAGPEAKDTMIRAIRVFWIGKIDRCVQDRDAQGWFWVWDDKTTSMLGGPFWGKFENSQAQIGYCWAAQRLFDLPFSGSVISAIVGRKESKTGTPVEFARRRYYYSQDRIDAWQNNTMVKVSDLVANLKRGFFPQEDTACVHFMRPCPFIDVCKLETPGGINARQLAELRGPAYTENTWTPLGDE